MLAILSEARGMNVFSDELQTVSELLKGRFRLDGTLGRGGMATVYAAHDLALNRPVALKVFQSSPHDPDEEGVKRFLREAQVLASVDHPNIVPISTWGGPTDGSIW